MGSGILEAYRYGNSMKIPKSKRARRVGVEIQKVAAEAVRRELQFVAPGAVVSIPEVRLSDDLQHAVLYCSIHNVDDPRPIQKHLLRFLPTIRREAARLIRIRKLPEMRFIWDDTLDKADRIEQLLTKVKGDTSEDVGDDEHGKGEGDDSDDE